jgi:Tol biopolymer transport system component
MALATGEKLGPYEVVSLLGAGGMGEVYRARDAKLGRDVAIKVLPAAFATDSDRMARFAREAHVLASLNHPNIAGIYGMADGALVMELVEGPTIAERIEQGPIPLPEALPIARQMADALEYAHEKGIIHRDLKPANVKVTPEGRVKILDFGLAKAMGNDPVTGDPATSPTLTMRATLAGVIMGTAAYMSPEQARGGTADKRADIWSFGVMLYEMLTGRQSFVGETVSDTLAAVLKTDPDWSALPLETPPAIRRLLRRCLERDRKRRIREFGDAQLEIEEALAGSPEVAGPGTLPRSRGTSWWAGLAVLLVAALWLAALLFRETPPERPVVRFQIPAPEKTNLNVGSGLKLSPDGKRLAFTGSGEDGRLRIFVRALDSLETRLIPGTEDSERAGPFWAPDSRFIGFSTGGKLRKVDTTGGPSVALCDLGGFGGGTWNRDGVILFGGPPGISRVSQAGGVPTLVTKVELPKEQAHTFPYFLPDGKHFIYYASTSDVGGGGVYLASLDGKTRKQLLAGGRNAQYAPPAARGEPGHLLFMRDGAMLAQPIDSRTFAFSGEVFPVAEPVGGSGNFGFFSVSAGGGLAYRALAGSPLLARLTWFDRQGKPLGQLGPPAPYLEVSLARDGTRAAVTRRVPQTGGTDIWLIDTAQGVPSQYTFGPAGNVAAVWSPDGTRLVYSSDRANPRYFYNLYVKDSRGVGNEEPLPKVPEASQWASDWSSNGQLLVQAENPKFRAPDLWVLPLEGGQPGGERKLIPFLHESFAEANGQFSPGDAPPGPGSPRWVAYSSNETGPFEVYVQSFPAGAGKFRVSDGGGTQPRWRRDGKELFYISLSGTLMAVDVKTAPTFEHGGAKPLFQTRYVPGFQVLGFQYDVARDGKRFLVITPSGVEEAASSPITVVLNWTAGLGK